MFQKIKKVLIMEASSRQVLPMAKGFSKLGYEVTTVCEKKSDLGNSTRYKKYCYVVSEIDSDYDKANKVYNKLIKENNYDLILPLSDFSAEIAANNKEKWEKEYNCKVAVNSLEVFNKAYDKLNTMEICMNNNIPCPYTVLNKNIVDTEYDKINYPVVVKPRSACGSIGFHKVDNENRLKELLKDTSHGPLLIQEFIPETGKQYNAHFFLDNNHNVKTAICTEKCRWFPIDGGASTLCRTIDNPYIIEICTKLLKIIGWVGYCDLDLIEDPRDGSIRVIEINARISANVKICFAMGANIAKQIDELYFSKEVSKLNNYKSDYRLRCIHTDLLWFIKSPNRMNTDPSWFSIKNTIDQIFSIDDIIPFFSFSITSIMKYKNEMNKRKR